MAPKATAHKRKAASSEAPAKKKAKISKANKPAAQPDKLVLEASDSDLDPAEDQTAALLKGFESASDSDNASSDDEAAKPLDLALLPDPTTSVSAAPTKNTSPNSNSIVYISRVPHGFHESQMQAYFTQFGEVVSLRLARNRRTGRSRHFAFVRFADAGVADIVARAMNNYLLFGHLLKCRVLQAEDVSRLGGVEGIFKGAGRRWKKVPWNAIERNRVAKTDRKGWAKRVRGEVKRRSDKAEKLRELGYEFLAPEVRRVEDVPARVPAAVEGPEGDAKLLENGAVDDAAAVVTNAADKDGQADGSKFLVDKKVKKASGRTTKKKNI